MMPRRLFIACLLLMTVPVHAVTLQDDEGHTVKLSAPAQRIVSLAPHVAELLFDIGAGDRVVGTVHHSDYPAAARAVPRIGDSGRIDTERLLALRPDVIVVWGGGNAPSEIARLRRLGQNVFVIAPHRLDDVARHLEMLGTLTGKEQGARRAAAEYRRELSALRADYAARAPVSVFYQVWRTPLMTVGGDQYISEAIALCGGRNIFAQLRTLAPTVSTEAVLAANPEIIITASEQPAEAVLGEWRKWPRLAAVRNGHLLTIDTDQLARPTPAVVQGVRRLCELIDGARKQEGTHAHRH